MLTDEEIYEMKHGDAVRARNYAQAWIDMLEKNKRENEENRRAKVIEQFACETRYIRNNRA